MRRSVREAVALAGSVLARALLLGVGWWAFVEGETGSWILSGAAVLGAVLVSLAALPPGTGRWRFAGLARFLPFFLVQSLRGGTDVAARAFNPRLPVLPGMIDHPLRLPEGPARVSFVVVLSLLPGTLSAQLRGDTLRVHLLHRGMPARGRIEELEARIAELFGVRL